MVQLNVSKRLQLLAANVLSGLIHVGTEKKRGYNNYSNNIKICLLEMNFCYTIYINRTKCAIQFTCLNFSYLSATVSKFMALKSAFLIPVHDTIVNFL